MSNDVERGWIEPASAQQQATRARVRYAYGEVSAVVSCIDVDWRRRNGTYRVRIVNNTDRLIHAWLRHADVGGGISVSSFSMYEKTVSIPIPSTGLAARFDVEGSGVTFTVDVPLPDPDLDASNAVATTGTIFP